MAVEVSEKFESRILTTGKNPSVELRYTAKGSDSDTEVRSAVEAASPSTYDPYGTSVFYLSRESVAVEPVGYQLWEGIVRYGPFTPTNEAVFSFDTGGGTQHITQSRATIGRYAASGSAPDHKGAIGVTRDSVDGVDITVPVYQFSETHYLADSAVTDAYKATLFNLTGKTNNTAFRHFAIGEVLFLGAAGSKRGYGDWEIAFRFAASPNATNLTVGDITGVAKQGWEYMWIAYEDGVDETAHGMVKRPVAVYVERVYDSGNFSGLGIG